MRFNVTTRTEEIRKSIRFTESFTERTKRILTKNNSISQSVPQYKYPDAYQPSLDQLRHNYRFRTFYGKPQKKQIIWLPPLHRIVLSPFQEQFLGIVQLLEWEKTGKVSTRASDFAPKNAVVVYRK